MATIDRVLQELLHAYYNIIALVLFDVAFSDNVLDILGPIDLNH